MKVLRSLNSAHQLAESGEAWTPNVTFKSLFNSSVCSKKNHPEIFYYRANFHFNPFLRTRPDTTSKTSFFVKWLLFLKNKRVSIFIFYYYLISGLRLLVIFFQDIITIYWTPFVEWLSFNTVLKYLILLSSNFNNSIQHIFNEQWRPIIYFFKRYQCKQKHSKLHSTIKDQV